MRLQNLAFDVGEGISHGLNLIQDVDTVLFLFHHLGDAAHLPFDTTQVR